MRIKSKVIAIVMAVAIFIGAGILGSIPAEGVPILAYHMVNDEDNHYSISTQDFETQMNYLKEQGYTPISLLEFAKARKGKFDLPAKPIIITFDDGYVDNYTNAVPIMEKYGMRGTIFIVVNEIGKKDYLSLEQLKDLEKRKIEIGSHTANHLPLATLSTEEKKSEIDKSKLLLEWKGLKTVFFMAYPNGSYDQEIEQMLEEGQYLGGCTGETGYNTFDTNPYQLRRINIPQPYLGLTEFKLRFMRANLAAHLGW